ncbi:DUF7269 family protein [Haloarchaeobius litoreus]|uniref:DUF4129 domain-containing protein n=1 Tax=Haloarchaeobius litoreus TaxID=755306 RepID=A0ABD6DNT0_9EURY|nr:hypothetical protein [Haloarchaeobius litoreus]
MSRRPGPRSLLLAVGLSLVGAGLLGTVAPGLVVGDAVALLVLVAGSVAAVALALVYARQDTRAMVGRATVPDRSGPRVPGQAADELLAGVTAAGRVRGDDAREDVYERLTAVAVDTLVARYDCTPGEARRRLETGSWTNDPVAAALFVEGVDPEWTTRDRLRTLWTGEPPLRRRARHALAELAALAGGER